MAFMNNFLVILDVEMMQKTLMTF